MSEPILVGNGALLRARREWPTPGDATGNILLVHGLGEHSGRYEHVGEWFAARGYSVSAFDLPGFGLSGGHRAHVETFQTYLDAVAEEIDLLPTDAPRILYGHSLGGLIGLSAALSLTDKPDRLVLSAPAVDATVPAWQRASAPYLAKIFPKLALANPISGDQLSTDPAVGEAYFADPLVYTKATTALGAALFAQMEWVQSYLAELAVPTYVLHGTDDTLVPPAVSAPLGGIPGVTRKLWPGLRHECHNEPSWEEVLTAVLEWLTR